MSQSRAVAPHRERLLLAGDALMAEHGNFDFGVREVVERAQTSLRTFYQYFETRDDFALAIYAELIRVVAIAISRSMPRGTRSRRFRHFVRALMCPSEWRRILEEYTDESGQRSRALVREGFRLREVRPDGFKSAMAPLRDVLRAVLGADSDDVERNITAVLNSLITETYEVIIDDLDAEAVAEHLYRYHKRALGL
jgi:AcrR family transcriptional regulator